MKRQETGDVVKEEESPAPTVTACLCPLCPRLYTSFHYLEAHLINSHGPVVLQDLVPSHLSKAEFTEKKKASDIYKSFSKEKPSEGKIIDVKNSLSTLVTLKRTMDGNWTSKAEHREPL